MLHVGCAYLAMVFKVIFQGKSKDVEYEEEVSVPGSDLPS